MTRYPVKVGERHLELSNLDKVLWPDKGITKGDLIHYYASVAERLLPHLRRRPLTLTRYPDGITGDMFYQKDTPLHAPDWLPTYAVASSIPGRMVRYLLAEEAAALVWLANQATIEIHPWMSTVEHPAYPDYAVIDLDPAEGATWADVVEIARLVRVLLERLDLVGFPKLSGATGIHIYVPLAARYSFAQTSQFVGFLGRLLVKAYPEKATNERLVQCRNGRVYIDHLQNLPGKTIVAPYVPRPVAGAPVSVPVSWAELGEVTPEQFSVDQPQLILKRPKDHDAMYSLQQSLDAVLPLLNL
ncbi:MAG: non-homologous end-joining DNA ligase [Limnochordia bacterium]|jgi:bifunctional non-homologous end joining protein LigD